MKNISIFGLIVDYSSWGIITNATYGVAHGVGRELVSRTMSPKTKEHIIIMHDEDECVIVD